MKRKFSLYRRVSQLLRLPLAGPVFRLYAPRRRWNQSEDGSAKMRVLIVNLMPSLGDTICYMPMVEVLASAYPDAEITWLADSGMAGLIARHPDVDRVLTVTTPPSFLQRIPTVKTYYRLYCVMRAVSALKLQHPFDVAIIPRGGVDPSFSAQAAWMLNLPRSTGYSHLIESDDIDHHYGDQLLSELIRKVTHLHEAARALHLLETSCLVPDAHQRWNIDMPVRGVRAIAESVDITALFAKAGIPRGEAFMVLSPGAGLPRKIWPAQKFRQLCAQILGSTKLLVILTGTRSEAELAAVVAEGFGNRVVNCAGKFSLAELIGLLSHATAFVGNDSGSGHIAGPLGVPTVSLHTQPRNSSPHHIHAPEHYRPIGPNVTIVQPDSFLLPCVGRCESKAVHCLDQITVGQVWAALEAALRDVRRPS